MRSLIIISLLCLALVPNTIAYDNSQISTVNEISTSECANMTVEVNEQNLTIPCTNISELYSHRPQLVNDSTFADIMTNYSEFFYSFLSVGERILISGMNASTYFEVIIELESYTGPLIDYEIVSEESLEHNMTMILERTLEELCIRNQTLENNTVIPYLWSGEWGLPTLGGPNNFYIGNTSFDELHWEVQFRTNLTILTRMGGYDLYEINGTARAIMIFLGNGTLLDFYIEPVPISDQSPILFYTIVALSATAIIGIVVVLFWRRR